MHPRWTSRPTRDWKINGHRVGEIAAACVARAMTIEAIFDLTVIRDRLVNQLPGNNGRSPIVLASKHTLWYCLVRCE